MKDTINAFLLACAVVVHVIWCVPLEDHGDDGDHVGERDGRVRRDKQNSTVVIFAFSGLRWDVGDIQSMPAIEELKKEGISGTRKIDIFQSETLPAFVTMVTGQYPDKHGILSNKMKDLSTGETFDVTETSPKWWNGSEPIWITNQNKQNGTESSALCYWPGHDVIFGGKKVKYMCHNSSASYVDPFKELTINHEITKPVMPFEERVDQVHNWLKMNAPERPSFIGVYFEEPLNTMIKSGVHSNETRNMLSRIDRLVADAVKCFKKDGVYDDITFVVTGESGVTEIDLRAHKEIFLDDKLSDEQKDKLEIVDDGPIMTIYTDDAEKESFVSLWQHEKGMKLYTNETIPDIFRFSYKSRTMPLIIVADEHWRVYKSRVIDGMQCLMGYDGKFPSSHALFVAKGPMFKKNLVLEAMGNVDVYGMLCKALNITPPRPHSGNGDTISKVIASEPEKVNTIRKIVVKIVKTISSKPRNLIVAIIVAVLLVFVATFLVISAVYKLIGCCACPSPPMLVQVSSTKLRKRKSRKEKTGHHRLLGDNELTDSELSSSDEFYFDSVERKK